MRGMTDKKEIEYITKMSDAAVYMVNSSINAFVSDDLDLATKVIANDDIIDELFGKAKDRLVETLRKDSSDCEQAIDLLMTAKYFERIGDHTATIAGWVVFSITGTHTYKIDEVINMEV
jgi:phosphate transport system protein